MCVSLCHQRKQLYFNHEDCSPAQCDLVREHYAPCQDCRHRQGVLCGLTRSPLPAAADGCCHHDVDLVDDPELPATPDLVSLLGVHAGESVIDALDAYDVYFETNQAGVTVVPVDDLAIPEIYGQGTEPTPDDDEVDIIRSSNWPDFEFDWEF